MQEPKRGGRPALSWVDYLQKNLEPSGRPRAKAKGESGSHSELLSRMNGIACEERGHVAPGGR